MKKILSLSAALLLSLTAFADEGMWLLPLIQKMNAKALAEAGCRLTPEQIYSINNSSIKDAIVQFGGGCTGEIISDEGLLVTNHHCGYSSIQGLSTPEHNYLMDGYWAMTRDKELPVKGLSVTFLQSMTDITDALEKAREEALKKLKDDPDREEKVEDTLDAFMKNLVKTAEEMHPHCTAEIESFYNDNIFYLIVYKVFKDVRFVGAPPASVGKFGGETDNWMWPRHTGDFSMFRVYADANNDPAEYSPDNRPYSPVNHLKVSLKGTQEGDYAMILGYPGRTQRFQTAAQLEQMIDLHRVSIDARTLRQGIMWEAMCADPVVQLKYADKYASSANGWKKWQGEELAFEKLGIIEREKAKEDDFMAWVGAKKKRQAAYGTALERIEKAVKLSTPAEKALTLMMEVPNRIELMGLSGRGRRASALALRAGETNIGEAVLAALAPAYRDYEVGLDRKEAAALLKYYREKAEPEHYLDSLGGGFDSFAEMDIDAYVDYLFTNSAFTSSEKLAAAIQADGVKALENDPASVLFESFLQSYAKLYPMYLEAQPMLEKASRDYTAGMLEWEKGKPSYPDANFTMRLTYGHVLPYSPKDGVLYRHFTTLKGVAEKEDPNNPEFIVPEKLMDLYKQGDYGRYADADGTLHTCFLTNNDITGGNSGSPVLDADGALIGLAFDGNWESMSSDVMFEPELQRCICVDIRYVLFLVDKLGGAPHIVEELDLIR